MRRRSLRTPPQRRGCANQARTEHLWRKLWSAFGSASALRLRERDRVATQTGCAATRMFVFSVGELRIISSLEGSAAGWGGGGDDDGSAHFPRLAWKNGLLFAAIYGLTHRGRAIVTARSTAGGREWAIFNTKRLDGCRAYKVKKFGGTNENIHNFGRVAREGGKRVRDHAHSVTTRRRGRPASGKV